MTKNYRYEFPLVIAGYGETIEEAWDDAVDTFCQDPGAPPDEEDAVVEAAVYLDDGDLDDD